jgi:hypothetical protein
VKPRRLLAIPTQEGVEKRITAVIPAKAGIPKHLKPRDSLSILCQWITDSCVGGDKLRGDDGLLEDG